MCTVSFIPLSDSSYLLGSNRDELKKRSAAKPPFIQENGNWLAPIDTEAGGTWIGTNKHGLTCSLINNYQGKNPLLVDRPGALSRGLLIPKIMHFKSTREIATIWDSIDLKLYNPFELIAASLHPLKVERWSWDGINFHHIEEPTEPAIWVSTGLDPQKVYRYRKEIFDNWLENHPNPDAGALRAFHSAHDPEYPAWSVAMMREIVQSVSATVTQVALDEIFMDYHDGFPLKSGNWERFVLI